MEILRKGPEAIPPKAETAKRCECPKCASLLEYFEQDLELHHDMGEFLGGVKKLRCLHCFTSFPRRWYHRLWDSINFLNA